MKRLIRTTLALGCLVGSHHLTAQPRPAAQTIRVDVAGEKAGSEPVHFVPVVGNWVVAQDGNQNVLMVDGREWKRGQPAGGLADKARLIYGSRHEEFIDNVKSFAYFPYA